MFKAAVRCLLLAFAILAASAASFAQVRVAISIGPPVLPVYEEPVCPGDGYIFTPGYWGWDDVDADYYWIPGTWVLAPEIGFLWTPGYWGWGDGGFFFTDGYWGPTVGFYGGISYGFGYYGVGYVGGRWNGDHFFYNQAVNNVNVSVTRNVYNESVNVNNVNRVSFNGGNGGTDARPTAQDETAARARHIPPVQAQVQHAQAARGNPDLRASVNHGKPPIAATPRPGAFTDRGVMPATAAGGTYTGPTGRGGAAPAVNASHNAIHPNDLPAMERPPAPNTGDPKLNKKYQQQQDKMYAKQQEERQQLQQKQDAEHQKMASQKANDQKTQQLEQKHQQQTQQLVQKHTQEQQEMQTRQAPPASSHGGSEARH